jgi:hypothetical protein
MGFFIPALVGLAAAGMGYAASKASTGEKSEANRFEVPFYEDPYYQKSQDILFPFGSDLLKGGESIPEYFRGIGEAGGPEFEAMLAKTTKDITTKVNEDLARRKVKGPLGAGLIAKQVSDTTAPLRYSDFLRSLEGKQTLMNTGLNTVSDVRNSALNWTQMKNNFNMGVAQTNYQADLYNKQLAAVRAAAPYTAIGTGINTAVSMYGISQLGSGMGAGTNTPITTANNIPATRYGQYGLSGNNNPFSYDNYIKQWGINSPYSTWRG